MKSLNYLSGVLLLAALFAPERLTAADQLELKKGDHVALLGGSLADRMQHHGWLETLLVAKYPQLDLVFRNLSAPADEVATWHRSENFGTRDEWLTRAKADVIFAFYGFNESFKGDAGLDKFKKDLDKFLKDTRAKNYSGKGAPRIVLFSPLANEKLNDPNQPDPSANNANLAKYAAAMADIARANDVQFVDVFTISSKLEGKKQPLTFNTFMLTESGDKTLAPEIFRALIGESAPSDKLDKLRAAINEKNAEWHHRYRTVDGYNVYGGRSGLAYQPGKPSFLSDKRDPEAPYVSNYKVMQE